MIAIVCVDDNGGMIFNHRRQSSDGVLREFLIKMCSGSRLWMNGYSARQFEPEYQESISVSEEFLSKAGAGEYCFVENMPLLAYEAQLEQVIVFKWNRVYPADMYFDLPLKEQGWRCVRTEEFPGRAHDQITMEVYGK